MGISGGIKMTGAWWASYGEPSLIAGLLLGLVWAKINADRRRRNFAKAGLAPPGQWLWFLASFVSMGSYLALICAVSLMAFHDAIAQDAMWFLLGSAGLAFCTALLFSRFALPTQVAGVQLLEQPSSKSLRKTA